MINTNRPGFIQISMGYSVSRLDEFLQYKTHRKTKKSRFDFGRNSLNTENTTESVDLNISQDNNKTINLLKGQEIPMELELTDQKLKTELPPEWVDVYDSIQDKLQDVQKYQKKCKELNRDRLKISFGDTSSQDKQIATCMEFATQYLMRCEKELKQIDQIKQKKVNNEQADLKIRENVKRQLACQIQQYTQDLRNEQKQMYNTLKKINSAVGGGDIEQGKYSESVLHQVTKNFDDDEQQQQDEYADLDNERDSEINKLVNQINELAHVFKQLNDLVIEQGTILDRIDCNIVSTEKHVKKAVKHLVKADNYQKPGKCVRYCTLVLIVMIVICTIILAFRYGSSQ